MTRLRRRLRLLAAAWLVLQAAALSAFVPRVCCANHRPVRLETQHGCHTSVAAVQCPIRGADGTPCPMHGDGQTEERRTCTMRGTCSEPMAAMFALLSNHGVLPEPIEIGPDAGVGAAAVEAPEHLIRRLTPPDSPPPRG